MTDTVSQVMRSANMAAVKGKNTLPERAVRTKAHKAGFRFRLHDRGLAGSPDLAFPRYRVAAFVHGCFWHGHDCPRGRRPHTNKQFWNAKIDGNIERDLHATEALQATGWTVVTIWTCDLVKGTNKLIALLRARRTRLRRPSVEI